MRAASIVAMAGFAHAGVQSSASLCQNTAQDIAGNWYCQAVNAITYANFGGAGSYNRITSMDKDTGSCGSAAQPFSGSIAPLDEDVSLHFRGPLRLKQLAFYAPSATNNIIDKRDARVHQLDTANRVGHGHGHAHAKLHKHRHVDASADEAVEKRDDPCNPANKPMVTATINGKVVSWVNDYFGPECAAKATSAPAAAAPAAAAAATSAAAAPAGNKIVAAAGSAASQVAAAVGAAFTPTAKGDWVRAGYYSAASGTSQGLTFLNNLGGGASGVWDTKFGNSLSYASADGAHAAASSQVLGDIEINDQEIIVMSDKACDASCGFSRQGTVAYKGFSGANKVFLLEFSMPDNGETGWNQNMPAIWMLNAQIPRTLQYGSCSCWPNCGELDLFEVLTPGETRCKSTFHGVNSGGDSNFFDRPTGGTIKAAVAMMDYQVSIKLLDPSFNFSQSLSNSQIQALASQGGSIGSLASSLFTLG